MAKKTFKDKFSEGDEAREFPQNAAQKEKESMKDIEVERKGECV